MEPSHDAPTTALARKRPGRRVRAAREAADQRGIASRRWKSIVMVVALLTACAYAIAHRARSYWEGEGRWTDARATRPSLADELVRHAAWDAPEMLSEPLNTRASESRPALSPDGRWLVFAVGERGLNADLWMVELAGGVPREAPRRVDALDGPDDELAPAFADGELWFASDRAGGSGGLDLWHARFDDGAFEAPVRFDDSLQSAADDTDPAPASRGGAVTFASNRGGDFDLYAASDSGSGWTVTRLTELSSDRDEREPALADDGSSVWFASNRDGGAGGFDLYRATYLRGAWSTPVAVAELNTDGDERGPAPSGPFELWFARTPAAMSIASASTTTGDDVATGSTSGSTPRDGSSRDAKQDEVASGAAPRDDSASSSASSGDQAPRDASSSDSSAHDVTAHDSTASDAAARDATDASSTAAVDPPTSDIVRARSREVFALPRLPWTWYDSAVVGALLLLALVAWLAQSWRGIDLIYKCVLTSVLLHLAFLFWMRFVYLDVHTRGPLGTPAGDAAPAEFQLRVRPAQDARAGGLTERAGRVDRPGPAGSALDALPQPSLAMSESPARATNDALHVDLPEGPSATAPERASVANAVEGSSSETDVAVRAPSESVERRSTAAPEVAVGTPSSSASSARATPARETGPRSADLGALASSGARAAPSSAMRVEPPSASAATAPSRGSIETSEGDARDGASSASSGAARVALASPSDEGVAKREGAPAAVALEAHAPSLTASAGVAGPTRSDTGTFGSIEGRTSDAAPRAGGAWIADASGAGGAHDAAPGRSDVAAIEGDGANGARAGSGASVALAQPSDASRGTRGGTAPGLELGSALAGANASTSSSSGPSRVELGNGGSSGTSESSARPGLGALGALVDRSSMNASSTDGDATAPGRGSLADVAGPASTGSDGTRGVVLDAPRDARGEGTRGGAAPSLALDGLGDGASSARGASDGPALSLGSPLARAGGNGGGNDVGGKVAAPSSGPLAITAPAASRGDGDAPARGAFADAPGNDRGAPAVALEDRGEHVERRGAGGAGEGGDGGPGRPGADMLDALGGGGGTSRALADEGPRRLELDAPARDRVDVPVPASAPLARAPEPDREAPSVARQSWDHTPYENRSGEQKARALELHGGDERTEAAVAKGLAYLARIQKRAGNWGRADERDAKYGQIAIGKTGLALLAFLGAGHTHRSGTLHSETVRKALDFLRAAQDPDTGHFGGGDAYCHGIATYAIGECVAMTGDEELRKVLQLAVEHVIGQQNGENDPRLFGGWSYYFADGHAFDRWPRTSITSWQVMALESARLSGVRVPDAVFEAGRAFLANARDEEQGFWRYNHDPERLADRYATLPASTPAGMFAMSLLGADLASAEYAPMRAFVLQRKPDGYRYAGDDEFVFRGTGNVYFWYYGTLAMFRAGGASWSTWNEGMKRTLVPAQNADGSWEPIDPYARYAKDRADDKTYTTAMCVLSLEVYYRYYLPLLKVK